MVTRRLDCLESDDTSLFVGSPVIYHRWKPEIYCEPFLPILFLTFKPVDELLSKGSGRGIVLRLPDKGIFVVLSRHDT